MLAPRSLALVAVAGFALPAAAQLISQSNPDLDLGRRAEHPHLVIDAGTVPAVLPGGKVVQMGVQTVWKPVCSNRTQITEADLQRMADMHARAFADPTRVRIVDTPAPAPRAGLNLVYVLGGNVPAAAYAAFAAAESYIESQFPNDTMTVTIPVSFAQLQSGVIGGTSSSYGSLTWADSRSTLIAGMDANDTIQSFLPATSIPVRYRSNRTTNEDRCFWTFANFKANGGSVTGNDASMTYSTAFPFDFDPSNGVTANTISLQDVIVHETGHALGFTSGLDFRNADIEVLDVYRFQRTDGNADYNPDTTAEFTARPRMGVFNYNDDHNFDIIGVTEYRLSDGSPYQCSHFREEGAGNATIGIMDPAFSYGETFYPNFLRTSDLTVFDALGYDR